MKLDDDSKFLISLIFFGVIIIVGIVFAISKQYLAPSELLPIGLIPFLLAIILFVELDLICLSKAFNWSGKNLLDVIIVKACLCFIALWQIIATIGWYIAISILINNLIEVVFVVAMTVAIVGLILIWAKLNQKILGGIWK